MSRSIGFNTDGTVFTMGNGEPDSVANFRGQGDPLTSNSFFHTYNDANFVALQMPLKRTSAYASANFDLTDDLELYAEGIYADYTVNTQLAPVAAAGRRHAGQQSVHPAGPQAPARLASGPGRTV